MNRVNVYESDAYLERPTIYKNDARLNGNL